MNKRMLRVIILISLVAALVLGGCLPGKPAAEAPAPAPEPAAPAPEASPEEVEPIKVGAPFALTGYFVEDAVAYSRGVELAVDDINAAGGLLGRPLEIVYFDTADFAPLKHLC